MIHYLAIGIGLGIAGVAAIQYVAVLEAYLYATGYIFMDVYMQQVLATKAAAGTTAAELARLRGELGALKTQYANPILRIPMAFAEIAPVGVLVALVTTETLRNSRAFPAHAARS